MPERPDFEWLDSEAIVYFHQMLVEEHGGLPGIRDEGALESTLARPLNLLHYQPEVSIHELAASYGYGFAKNHVFHDGNKRIALASIDVFLQINGYQLIAGEVNAVVIMRDVASGALDESDLAIWIRENSVPFNLEASE